MTFMFNDLTIVAWLLIVGIVWGATLLTIWARRYTRARALGVLMLLVAGPIAAGALGLSLGWAVPSINGVTIPPGKHDVLGVKIVEDVAIYLLIDIGTESPRLYKLPYSVNKADELQGMMDENDGVKGIGVNVPPFEFSFDQEPSLWADPQPKVLPDKPPTQQEPVEEYTNPNNEI